MILGCWPGAGRAAQGGWQRGGGGQLCARGGGHGDPAAPAEGGAQPAGLLRGSCLQHGSIKLIIYRLAYLSAGICVLPFSRCHCQLCFGTIQADLQSDIHLTGANDSCQGSTKTSPRCHTHLPACSAVTVSFICLMRVLEGYLLPVGKAGEVQKHTHLLGMTHAYALLKHNPKTVTKLLRKYA